MDAQELKNTMAEKRVAARALSEEIARIKITPENKDLLTSKLAEYDEILSSAIEIHDSNLATFKGAGYCMARIRCNVTVDYVRVRLAKLQGAQRDKLFVNETAPEKPGKRKRRKR